MANTLKIKRGAAASIPQGQLAEPLFTTDTYDLYIGKGSGGNQRIQNYIASGTSSQFLKGDGTLDSTTYQATSEKGQNNGYASLDAGGKIPAAQLPSSVIEYKGTWNASTNTPTLADGTGDAGDVYIVSVGGTQNLGSGSITFAAGDWVMYNGAIWQKSTGSNAVASVNGQTGVVTITFDQLSPMTTLGDTIYGAASGAGTRLAGNITVTKKFLSQTGTGTASAAPSWQTVTQSDVGLSNVENTALSTWAGSANITTLGTITSGTWNGTTISIANGGTGQTTKAAAFNALSPMTTLGDIIYGGASGAGTRLAGNTTASKRFLIQTGDGTNSAAPSWGSIAAGDVPDLSATYLPLAGGTLTGGLSGTTGTFSGVVQSSAIKLTDMTAGSGALYYNTSAKRLTLANYNADGILVFEVNGGNYAMYLNADLTMRLPGYTTNGILKFGNSDGTIGVAVAGDFPTLNQNTTGSAATLTTARTLTIGATGKTFDGSANVSWSLAEIGAAAALSGTSGRVAYWNSGTTIAADDSLLFSPTSTLAVNNVITAAAGGASAFNLISTINAAANNDILYGVRISPTFNNGAFTGVTQRALGVFGNVYINGTITSGAWNGSVIGSSYGGAGTVSGIMKANGSGTVSAAVAGTDYVIPSALNSYLPLTGGTLTGALSGTSATFSGDSGFGTSSVTSIAANSRTVEIYGGAGGGFIHFTNATTGVTASDGFIIGTSVGGSDALIIQRENANLVLRTNDTDRLTINGSGAATFNSEGITINRSAGNPYVIFQTAGSDLGSIYGNTGGGIRLRNATSDVLTIASTGAATFSSSVTATNFYSGSLTNEQWMISGTGSRGLGISTITSGDPYLRFYNNTTIKADMWWDRAGDFQGINSVGGKTCLNPYGGEVLINTTTDSGAYYLQVNGSVYATAYYESSDIRLKDVLSNSYSENFSAIEFMWKDKRDDKKHWGYAAQDVMKYIPDAIEVNNDGMMTVNYNEAHTWKIAQLEAKIVELESKLK